MGYMFRTDLHIEYPFFVEMSHKLNGVKRDNFNGQETFRCVCPKCGKHKAVMGYARSGDTFILACPVEVVTWGYDTPRPHQEVWGESMFKRWRKARWKTTYTEDWLPIKNARGPSPEVPHGFIRSSKLPSAPRSRCLFPVLCALREATRNASASLCLVWKCFHLPQRSWYSISTLMPLPLLL